MEEMNGKKPELNRNRKVPSPYFIPTAFAAAPSDVDAGTTGVRLTVVVPSSITGPDVFRIIVPCLLRQGHHIFAEKIRVKSG